MKNANKPINPIYGPDRYLESSGLTKREYFAGLALQGILSNRKLQLAIYRDSYNKDLYPKGVNRGNALEFEAVRIADTLLKELKK